jgi:transposase-like protein
MTNAKRSKAVWAELVAECEAGEAPSSVAERHGVNVRTLRWWRSHLRGGAAAQRSSSPRARLMPVIVDDGARGEVQVVFGDWRVTFPMDTPIAYVKQLVAVLRSC